MLFQAGFKNRIKESGLKVSDETINQIKEYKDYYCNTEKNQFPWVWFVWGSENISLTPFKKRFNEINARVKFFFDKNAKKVVERTPGISDFAKHTQGLPHECIVQYISMLLKTQ